VTNEAGAPAAKSSRVLVYCEAMRKHELFPQLFPGDLLVRCGQNRITVVYYRKLERSVDAVVQADDGRNVIKVDDTKLKCSVRAML
jgi:hypothetical protein